ncbi:hypothetical protein AYL99_03267 [Fonsecaea erecta]|uniref:Uncharacterized protein n=1 Tax=Fonsecaea erecta TaxID=1367422 RepID=A0A178ZNV8_9EURO|nr:hypothetical protein AYL99_03267 [Fonsecaea erecta]OAP61066.1 hypothetical protein AYL99_03267 [Fonsecaea erecta]
MSPTKTAAAAGPLAERSPNPTSPTKSKSPGKLALADAGRVMPRFEMPSLAQQQQQQQRGRVGYVQGRNRNQNPNTANQTYISPSDAIRSPATKKLSEIKERRILSMKPQMLFAKTLAQENLKAKVQAQGQSQDGVQH